MKDEIRCIISGRVQMVMYRDFVQRNARKLGVTGIVRNLPDKTVEVVAQGKPDDLRGLISRLHEGSVLSRVDDVSVEWRSPDIIYDDFSILYA